MSESKIWVKEVIFRIGCYATQIGYALKIPNGTITIFEGINHSDEKVFHFFLRYKTERSIGDTRFYIPVNVDSYEQALAMIAYNMRDYDARDKPDWLIEGESYYDLLPHVKRQREFDAIPKACIESEWFRVFIKKLRTIFTDEEDTALVTLSFNGAVLTIACNGQILSVIASGTEWSSDIKVTSGEFKNAIPKRIKNTDHLIYRYNEELIFSGKSIPLFIELEG